jgi:hypothetical protein
VGDAAKHASGIGLLATWPTSPSQQIVRATANALGGALAERGFVYLKSKRSATRERAPWTEGFCFVTSRLNVLPDYMAFEVRCHLNSDELGAWRREHQISHPLHSAYLISTDVENVTRAAPPYIRYNVHHANERTRVIERVIEVIHTEVLPFFDLIRDPAALCVAVESGAYPCLSAREVDLFLWSGDRELARRYLTALARRESPEPLAQVAKSRGLG